MNVTKISHVLVIKKIYMCERASVGSVDCQQFDLNVKKSSSRGISRRLGVETNTKIHGV